MQHPPANDHGFTLVETLVALALLAAVATGVAHLFAVALTSGRTARDSALMTAMAAARLEQLRSLAWRFDVHPDAAPAPISDVTSDLSHEPFGAAGPGLAESPASSLATDAAGYVDYLDETGQWVGTLPTPPDRAVYVRRWAVRHLTSAPGDAIGLQVLVAPLHRERRRRPTASRPWTGEDVLLATIVARRAW